MTEAQLIRRNHADTESAWERAKENVRGNPAVYRPDRFPNALRDCETGAQLCRDIIAEARG